MFKTIPKSVFARAALLVAFVATLCAQTVQTVQAASSFGDMADNVKNELTRFGPLLQAGFALGGFALVGLGLWQLWSWHWHAGTQRNRALKEGMWRIF